MSASGSRPTEEKMESEHSDSSGESSSSTDSSSGSSEGEEELMEPVRILGHTLELPQELCEDYAVFKEFFSMRTWNAISEENKEVLKQYLPKFRENDEEEKEKTIKMFFNHEPFHFTSPLDIFFNNLRQGNYRPDIARMRKFLRKARAKQQAHKLKSYYAKLLPEVLISRERLLAVAKGAPLDSIPSLPPLPPRRSSRDGYTTIYSRVKNRYFEELAAIRSEVGGEESEDDNYPDGPPEQFTKKKKQVAASQNEGNVSSTLGARGTTGSSSLACLKKILAIHRARKQYREIRPEFDTTGITLEDIKQRVALVNGAKKLMFGGAKNDGPTPKLKRGPKPKDPSLKAGKSTEGKGGKKKEEIAPVESVENRPLLPNIKIKCEQEESDSEASSFVDPVTSPKHNKRSFDQVEVKQEVIDPKYPNVPSINYNDPNLETVIKQEPLDPPMSTQNSARIVQPVPIKLEDLDGIDMMALPIEIADDSGEVVVNSNEAEEAVLDPDEALTETTHANFLSLVRALFPARAAHRASKQQLHARLAAVMRSPIAPLNTWYSLLDDWCSELDSALSFLAGERGPHPEDFVPYLQFMPETQMYQWIGAGRDCDAILGRICERWLRAADPPAPPPPPTEPAPPKFPTSWVIRQPTSAEIAEFRAQERKRFAAAAKPYTYIQHGYRSVVGPCARASITCAGNAALLVADRPRHANFLALVRDAVARLPNGEGTRHDVVTLIKMSQWIAPCTDQALLTAVSTALDRMHSAKRDPFVKYDQRTAVWTYLHRHRSEEDWLKTASGRGRTSKPAAPAPAPLPALPAPAPAPAPPALAGLGPHDTTHGMDMEVASIEEVVDNGSDTDVDVDDSNSPTAIPHLSSAQLLMQATQSQAKLQIPHSKPKGKLVAVSPPKPKSLPKQANQTKTATQPKPNLPPPAPKQPNTGKGAITTPKPTPAAPAKQILAAPPKPVAQSKQNSSTISPKQANLMAQAAKQASLMAQSAKQANVIAQLTKPVQKNSVIQTKQVNVVKQPAQSPKQSSPKTVGQAAKPAQVKQPAAQQAPRQEAGAAAPATKPAAPTVPALPAPHKSPLIKQRPLQKPAESPTTISAASILTPQAVQVSTPIPSPSTVSTLNQNKVVTGTRSLLLRAPAPPPAPCPAPSPAPAPAPAAQASPVTAPVTPSQKRGIVRVLSPATSSGGKSLISPRALMQSGTPTTKKRATPQEASSVTTIAQSTANVTTVVSSIPTAVTSSFPTRTVQLAGGRTVQLTANQTVHLPGGQAVQLSSGHTLQLSSLQLPTHSVRLPSGQTVQLASPQAIRVSSTSVKTSSPRPQPSSSSPTVKTAQSNTVQIPISSVQLAGQTVQIAGQTVQLAGQSVQLTGHTVKLPSGQSVQVASQSVMPSQSVQLPSGQTVQLASGNVQTVQLGQNVLTNQVAGQAVQLSGQTVQLAGQTVQLPSGQTLQLAGGQTIQLSSGQTIQLAGGQAIQLANQQKAAAQARQPTGDKLQPIVAKLLTQGQMISLAGAGVGGVAGVGGMGGAGGMRVLSPARPRPLLLAAAKPLHNVILQQGDGGTIRVTSAGGTATSQTIVLSNIGAQSVTTSTTSAPVLKLQQAVPSSSAVSTSGASAGAMRGVVMDGHQLKLVGGRHVLARILRPAHPPHPPQ